MLTVMRWSVLAAIVIFRNETLIVACMILAYASILTYQFKTGEF